MQKIIVFDLDETLGYFTQLGIFCDALDNCIEIKDSNVEINCLESIHFEKNEITKLPLDQKITSS